MWNEIITIYDDARKDTAKKAVFGFNAFGIDVDADSLNEFARRSDAERESAERVDFECAEERAHIMTAAANAAYEVMVSAPNPTVEWAQTAQWYFEAAKTMREAMRWFSDRWQA